MITLLYFTLLRHLQACLQSLGKLFYSRLATCMTVGVIAIALALPVGLFTLLSDLQTIAKRWQSAGQLSLYLEPNLSQHNIDTLIHQLRTHRDVADVRFISAEEGLNEFTARSGLSDIMHALDENPLPAVIDVYPTITKQNQEEMAYLLNEFTKLPHVAQVQMDQEWLQRLQALIKIGQRTYYALSLLFILALLLIVANTIRLTIQQQRKDIQVMQLLGATQAFIRRPFLYSGFFYGALGGFITVLLINGFVWLLSQPIQPLALSYQSDFRLHGLSFTKAGQLIVGSGFLSLLSAGWMVHHHLRKS